MKCPKCNGKHLVQNFIEGLFRSHACKNCGGNWLLVEDYVAWKERNPEYEFTQEAAFEAEDTNSK